MRLVGGESEVERKCKSLHRDEKFCCVFGVVVLLLWAKKEGSKWTAGK